MTPHGSGHGPEADSTNTRGRPSARSNFAGATPAQASPAWVLRQAVPAVPRSGRAEHVRENREALDLELTDEDPEALGLAFPPPSGPVPPEVL